MAAYPKISLVISGRTQGTVETMKHGLRRIEATLNHLPVQAATTADKPVEATQPQSSPPAKNASPFFTLSHPVPSQSSQFATPAPTSLAKAPPHGSTKSPGGSPFITLKQAEVKQPEALPVKPTAEPAPLEATAEISLAVQPFPVAHDDLRSPSLPRFKSPSFSSHRHGPNPGLALGLLKEIESKVTSWQEELNQIVRQIQEIYMEGPIVDGWLESHDREPETGSASLRHAEVDRLMDYVEEICGASTQQVSCQSPRTGYRLCGLNADGQLWFRPCPPEQIPSVSLAIARYQKLRNLLNRKQELETRLSQLAETLVVVHSHLQEGS